MVVGKGPFLPVAKTGEGISAGAFSEFSRKRPFFMHNPYLTASVFNANIGVELVGDLDVPLLFTRVFLKEVTHDSMDFPPDLGSLCEYIVRG